MQPYECTKSGLGRFFPDIGQFFQDDATHRFSAIRLVLLAWAIGTLGVWGFISLNKTKIEDLPPSVQVVLLTLLTGKVVQKFGEKEATKNADELDGNEEDSVKATSTQKESPQISPPTPVSSNGHMEKSQDQQAPTEIAPSASV